MKREHLVEKDWDGPGVYLCKCGASLQAVNRDMLNWIFLDHCVDEALREERRKVKELSRAIECLPKPQEGMGGSASERVANVIFLLQKAREERERVREICAVVCREAGDRAGSVARDLEKAGLVANSFRAEQEGLLSAGRRILELDLTKDLAPSTEELKR